MRKLAVLIMILAAGCASTPDTGSAPIDKTQMSEGYFTKGLAHLQVKNFEPALVEFQRAIQTDSKNKKAYYALGLTNDMLGKPKEAEEYYKEAIDIDSDYSEAHNALGVVYMKQQKWDKAVKEFHRALENKLYATPHLPWLNMGDAYMAAGQHAKAIEAYRESKRYVNQDLIVFKLGNALLEAGKVKEAIAEYREGVSLAPSNANIRYGLAVALLKNGQKSDAVSEFRKAAELDPKSEVARLAKEYLKTLR